METVLHRLHLQGSRTIIDNLDSGLEVVPVITRYEGFFDCCDSVRAEEGFAGFYRGFGALILQYAIRFAAIKTCTVLARKVVKLINNKTSTVENAVAIQELQRRVSRQYERENSTTSAKDSSMYIGEVGSGDYPGALDIRRQNESIQLGESFGGYIPASAFTEENDPYKHVRHAM